MRKTKREALFCTYNHVWVRYGGGTVTLAPGGAQVCDQWRGVSEQDYAELRAKGVVTRTNGNLDAEAKHAEESGEAMTRSDPPLGCNKTRTGERP